MYERLAFNKVSEIPNVSLGVRAIINNSTNAASLIPAYRRLRPKGNGSWLRHREKFNSLGDFTPTKPQSNVPMCPGDGGLVRTNSILCGD